MNFRLASALLKGKWAIDPLFAIHSAGMVGNILSGDIEVDVDPDFEKKIAIVIAGAKGKAYSYYNWPMAADGSVAIIDLQGPLMKNDQYCGPVGMETIGQRLKEADADKRFKAIILRIDSPGGTVDGTETFANIVKNTKKPVIAFIDGLMASAALWIGVNADKIIASTGRTEVGSVGVLLSFADVQPAYERKGVKFHTIVADQSEDKTKMYENIRKGDYKEFKKEVLNPLAADFIAHVKQARPGAGDEHTTGKVFFAQDSIGVFVDEIGSFEEAVDRAIEMATNSEDTYNSNINNNTTMTNKYKGIVALTGDFETEAEGAFLSTEALDAVEDSIAESTSETEEALQAIETERDEAVSARETAETELSTAQAQLDEAQAENERLTAENSDLRSKPAAKPAAAITGSDKPKPSEGVGEIFSESDDIHTRLEKVGKEFFPELEN